MKTELKKYLQTPPTQRRTVLKKQYLAGVPKRLPEREQALFHLGRLVEYTRRLNMIECKSADQATLKPSEVRKTDLFLCVEICAEGISEDNSLQNNANFFPCWMAFDKLVEETKSHKHSEDFFEAAYLLLHLSALIFKGYLAEGTPERDPGILSIEGYKAIVSRFPRQLFKPNQSMADQLESLVDNLKNLSRP